MKDRGGGGAGRATALPLFCWDLFSRAIVDMEKITRGIIGLFPKRWTPVRASCFRRILENYMQILWKSGMFACPDDYNPMCVQG